MKIFKIEKSDNTVAIMRLIKGDVESELAKGWEPNKELGETEEDFSLDKIGVVSFQEIEKGDIPQDRSFRGAWVGKGQSIEVDLPKAREIHMSRIRESRDRKLEKLDVEQLKGRDVAAEKQSLRDLPNTFDLSIATTPDELKALWPKELL